MQNVLRCCLLPLILAIAYQTASADQMIVADLYGFCTSKDNLVHNACSFYILGVFEGAQVAAGVVGDNTHFCVPEKLSSSAMEMIVRKDMGADLALFPDDKKIPAISFVTSVIVKEFPCGAHPK